MSEILDLAKSFEAKSKQQAQHIESDLKSEFERHSRFISEALRSSERQISDDIHAHSQNCKHLALKGWLWMVLSLALVFSASAGALWWTGERIADNLTEIERQEQTLRALQGRTFGVELKQDRNGRFIVLPEGHKASTGWTVGNRTALKLEQE
jgi:F0F1-type ATP synthase membrane subunit b/b'